MSSVNAQAIRWPELEILWALLKASRGEALERWPAPLQGDFEPGDST